ncbi:hypothetical protein ACVDG8_008615 [Mesorhizobium sp. ORM8.1]
MAPPREKLAESLAALKDLQDRHIVAIRSSDLSRTHRERLLNGGFLQEVMKGWYIPANPRQRLGETTGWYASFWDFCTSYLNDRFGKDWCLAPEPSLSFHAGNRTVPGQLLVRSPAGGNKPTALPHGTSIYDMRASMPGARDVAEIDGLRLYALPAALIEASPAFFTQKPTDARTALAVFSDASEILARLLEGGTARSPGGSPAPFATLAASALQMTLSAACRLQAIRFAKPTRSTLGWSCHCRAARHHPMPDGSG